MEVPRNLRSSGFLSLLSNRKALGAALLAAVDIVAKVVGFVITPYLANRMGAAEFGALNLYIATTDILAFVIFLGGPALVTAEYVRNGEIAALRLRAACIRVSLRIAPVVLIGCIATSWFAPAAVPFAIGLLLVAVAYVNGLNVLELAFYRGAHSYPTAVAGQFSFTLLNLLLTIAAFELVSATATNRLLSIALAGALVQVVYAFDVHRKRYEQADSPTRRANTAAIITFGLSISVHVASHWVRLSVDRFALAAYAGIATAGVYSVAISMAMVPSVFFSVVSQQLQPFLYRRLKDNKFAEFRTIQIIFTSLAVLATAVYYGFLLLLFDRVFNRDYSSAKYLLLPLLGGSMAQAIYFVFSHASFYERRGSHISALAAMALTIHLLGLGLLAMTHKMTPWNVAIVYLVSSTATTIAMAGLSIITVRRLAAKAGKELA